MEGKRWEESERGRKGDEKEGMPPIKESGSASGAGKERGRKNRGAGSGAWVPRHFLSL